MEVGPYIRAVRYRAVDGGECTRQKFFPECIASVGEAVLGYVDRLFVGFQFHKSLIDGLWIELPTDVGEALVRILVETIVDDVSAVVIESDEILMIFDAIEEPSIPEGMCDCFECTIYERIFSEFK